MDLIDLRTAYLPQPVVEAESSSGAAAAFALVTFVACCVGTLAGAILF